MRSALPGIRALLAWANLAFTSCVQSAAKDHAVGEEQQHRTEDSEDDCAEVEVVYAVADPEGNSQETADKGAGDAEKDGDDDSARLFTGHKRFRNEAGNEADDDPRNDTHGLLPFFASRA